MKKFFSDKITLSPLWQGLIYLGLSGFMLLFCVALQPGDLVHTLGNLLREPRLLLLNLFPVMALLGLLWALLGNLFWAGSLSSLLLHSLSLVNLIKMECRKDPLVPADFQLLGEAMVATGEYRLDLHIPYWIVIFLVALGLLFLGLKLKSRPRVWLRIGTLVLCAGLFVGAMTTVYPDKALYEELVRSIQGLNSSNVPKVFDETGFLYCFLHNYQLYPLLEPEGYNAREAAAWANAPTESVTPEVDLLFIQAEAFSELYDADAFDYPEGENPLTLYHQVAEDPQSISGRIVVSNYGAGTANTEFDVLTGIQTTALNDSETSAFRVVHKSIPSLARSLSAVGYQGWFTHPGQRWFYNRESVYNFLGISDQCFLDGYKGDWPKKGGYISDEGFGLMIRQRYESHKAASEDPWFAFTVTIQNHQAYPWTKYTPAPKTAPLKIEVSAAALEELSVYAEGVRDSARLLWDLTEYFDRQEDPLLLVFWGDHLPNLGKSFSVYRELGLDIGNEADPAAALDTYSTPFVIWGNRAYWDRQELSRAADTLELPEGRRISDIYLAQLAWELAGLSGTDPFWDFLGQLRRQLPVLCRGRYELPDGSITESLSPEQEALVRKLRCWGYYRLTDQQLPS